MTVTPLSKARAASQDSTYVGRFAPSPTGPLHQGSLAAAMASFLDARVHNGRWLVRIEDADTGRAQRAVATAQVSALADHGMVADAKPEFRSERTALYSAEFERLQAQGHIFACACSRSEIADSAGLAPDGALVYPGTCRLGTGGRPARSWRVRVPDTEFGIDDRALGPIAQNLAREVGDFVVRRADGTWAYQLAVVVDDEAQGITDVVRGADLALSTPRQVYLQGLLGYRTPRYLHVPVVTDPTGAKLSKQTGAIALEPHGARASLQTAARHLGLDIQAGASLDEFWREAIAAWSARWRALAHNGA